MTRDSRRKLSRKLRQLDDLSLKSMLSGLRSMKKGQKHLIRQIEVELSERRQARKP